MSMSNEAIIVHGAKDIRVENVDVQQIGDNDVLLAMDKIGICGTDLHIYLDGDIPGMGDHRNPWIIGHEGSGRVLKLGSSVKHLKVGDRAVLNPNDNCHTCDLCLAGKQNLCCDVKKYYWGDRGLFEKFHVHPADCAYKIPDSMGSDEAAVVEPVACAVYGVQRGKVKHGQTVLVCGAGPIGLLHMMVAKAYGAGSVIITDIDPHRLEEAAKLGASRTILIDRERPPETTGKQVFESVGSGIDVVLECSGTEFSITLGIHAAKAGGKVVLVGLSGKGRADVPVNDLQVKEVDILTCICYRTSCFQEALKLVESREVDVRPLISHTFSYKDVMKAFEALADKEQPTVKILIDFAG